MPRREICPECNLKYDGKWCVPCNLKHFKDDFINWTSGNDKIDKFIQNVQLISNSSYDVIEWIPYDRFNDVKQIGRGGFGTIHYARWIDGVIDEWDIENQQWKRWKLGEEVALKTFHNLNLNNLDGVLNEMAIHLKIQQKSVPINFYGITQDPKTHKYSMVLLYAKDGNLREYLRINNINWERKLSLIFSLSRNLMHVHSLNILHQDFHPGNIVSYNFETTILITDFGLSKLMEEEENLNSPEKKKIIGVLPYIAPEVLCGKEYTKAADVYSFGIIVYEIVTGFPPYPDIPHDLDLAIKICNGLRPKIPFHIPKLIAKMITRCWDARVKHRPTFVELFDESWNNLKFRNLKDMEIGFQIQKAKEFSANQESTNATTPLNYQTHPQAFYTITGFPPYPDIPHDLDLAIKICNGLRPKIPFHIPKLIAKMITRCWDARVKHRPTFVELFDESWNNLKFRNLKDMEIGFQIQKAKEFSANQESTNATTPLNYQTHPQAFYTSRLLNYSNLPQPKNEENFERKLEELTKSMFDSSTGIEYPICTNSISSVCNFDFIKMGSNNKFITKSKLTKNVAHVFRYCLYITSLYDLVGKIIDLIGWSGTVENHHGEVDIWGVQVNGFLACH
ncbi:hypothetical protein Glove_395g19 [Diversispora epigaea]|uniref:Protein kinase domain-containing protein n=1 Tax=Diversispora epigaea TaxID=1348612 RepID=A0A397H4Z9_9GLOM|nr:hypothetical protein Glove_395g19 [Diversispora epigaea]